jgi:hypothetical protein
MSSTNDGRDFMNELIAAACYQNMPCYQGERFFSESSIYHGDESKTMFNQDPMPFGVTLQEKMLVSPGVNGATSSMRFSPTGGGSEGAIDVDIDF